MNLQPTAAQRADAAGLLRRADTIALADCHAAESLRATLPSLIAAFQSGDREEEASMIRWLAAIVAARAVRIGELEKVAVTFEPPRVARAA